MRTPAEPSALVDTNVLVYATDREAPEHANSIRLLRRAAAGDVDLRLAPQVVLEYLSVVTNPKRVAKPMPIEAAWVEARKFMAAFALVPTPADLLPRVAAIDEHVQIARGSDVFDIAIAATALAAGLRSIYTYDPRIFSRVAGLSVRTP